MRPGCSVEVKGSEFCDPSDHTNFCANLMDDSQGVWSVPHQCVGNFITAIRNRGVVQTPNVQPMRYNKPLQCMLGYRRKMGALLGKVSKLNIDELIAWFPKAKRTLYNKVEDLVDFIEKDSHCHLFVKDEKHPLKGPGYGDTPDPRMIYAKSRTYNCIGFSLLREIEHRMMTMEGDGHLFPKGRVFAKGLNSFQRYNLLEEKWNSLGNSVCAVKLDWSRFDSTVNTELLKIEHGLYLDMHSGNKLMKKWSSKQMVTHGKGYIGETKIKVKMTGGRCSGDVNTGFGNSFLTAGMISTFCKNYNLSYNLIVDGDDAIAFVNKKDLLTFTLNFPNWCTDLGTNVKVEGVYHSFGEIVFCQARPFSSTRMMVIDPLRVVNRFAGNSKGFRRPTPDYMVTIGMCELAVNDSVPVIGAWANRMYQAGLLLGGKFQKNLLDDYKRENLYSLVDMADEVIYHEPFDDDRLSFLEMTGLTIKEQKTLENIAQNYDFELAFTIIKQGMAPIFDYNEPNYGGDRIHYLHKDKTCSVLSQPPGSRMSEITGLTCFP